MTAPAPTTNKSQLVRTIKAHIAAGDKAKDKAEQHYVSASQHLKTLKANRSGSWAKLEALLRNKVAPRRDREVPVKVVEYVADQIGTSWEKAYDCISRLDDKRFEYRVLVAGGSDPCGVVRVIEVDGGLIRPKGRPRL